MQSINLVYLVLQIFMDKFSILFATPINIGSNLFEAKYSHNMYFYFRSIYERDLLYQYLVTINYLQNIYLDNPVMEFGEYCRRKKGRRKYESNELTDVSLEYLYNDSDYAIGVYIPLSSRNIFLSVLRQWVLENNYVCYHKTFRLGLKDIQLINLSDFYGEFDI